MLVDLSSDTVTQPTPEMRAAMADAEVGDDAAGRDPTVNRLQSLAAALLGTEAALFVPTGTMANQLALRALARPGTEVACGPRSHVFCYEDAGAARNAGLQLRPVADWERLGGVLDGHRHHMPAVSVVAIENTRMADGGVPMDPVEVTAIASVAAERGIPVHCDGARLWNAAIALDCAPRTLVADCTTVMVCLSKGLAAPVGSLLCGPRSVIDEARADRHRLGGAWRQAGILAAAGIVALETMVERLADDHERAARLATELALRWPGSVDPAAVRTNIVCAATAELPVDFCARLAAHDILAGTLDVDTTRFVLHHGIDDDQMARVVRALDAIHRDR